MLTIPDWVKLFLLIVCLGMTVGIPFAWWADKQLNDYEPRRGSENG